MNCKMLLLKIAKLSEFVIPLSRLFHLITVNRKNEFLKKVCLTLNLGILSILFLVLYVFLVVGIKRDFGLIFSCLKKIAKFSKLPPLF